MKRLILGTTSKDILVFTLRQCLKVDSDFGMTVCEEGIMVHRSNIYSKDIPIDSKLLSRSDCEFIMKCFRKTVDILYVKLNGKYVVAAGKKVTRNQKAKQDKVLRDEILDDVDRLTELESVEDNDNPEYPYRPARRILSEGGAIVSMMLFYNETQAKEAIKEGLDVYAFNAPDAQKLLKRPIHHYNLGEDGAQAPHFHETTLNGHSESHIFYGKVCPSRNLDQE